MSGWQPDLLKRIAESDDLHIAPYRGDLFTFGTPTWIWSVVVGDDLYVRAYNGVGSRWYQAAVKNRSGRITAAGATIDVGFEPAAESIGDLVDDAYRVKYRASQYLGPMTGPRARAAAVRIVPISKEHHNEKA